MVLAVLGDQSRVEGLDEGAWAGAGLGPVPREAEGILEAGAPGVGAPLVELLPPRDTVLVVLLAPGEQSRRLDEG